MAVKPISQTRITRCAETATAGVAALEELCRTLMDEIEELQIKLEAYRSIDKKRFTAMTKLEARLRSYDLNLGLSMKRVEELETGAKVVSEDIAKELRSIKKLYGAVEFDDLILAAADRIEELENGKG